MVFAEKTEKIKNDILGRRYSLSIAFVTPEKSREINKKYRKKDKATNVLSFALGENSGEILLCKAVIKKEAREKKETEKKWLHFLVIHGMLHLKGMRHGSIMDKAQAFYFEKYDQKHFGRNRRGFGGDKSRSRRVREGRKKS